MTTTTTNEKRADRARRALDCYESSDDFEGAAVDLMVDLLHMFEQQTGTHPEVAQRLAWHHFVAEQVVADR